MKSQTQLKDAVADFIIDQLEYPKLLLFGSGSTVNRVIQRYKDQQLQAVASSLATSMKLSKMGLQEINLDLTLTTTPRICIDGADLVINKQHIIKGHGGALLREKITWQHATEIIVAIDETKLSQHITTPIPVVITEFGFQSTISQVKRIGSIKDSKIFQVDGLPYHTDDGNLIIHITVNPDTDLAKLHEQLMSIAGVLETGIFLQENLPPIRFICGTQDGILEF